MIFSLLFFSTETADGFSTVFNSRIFCKKENLPKTSQFRQVFFFFDNFIFPQPDFSLWKLVYFASPFGRMQSVNI